MSENYAKHNLFTGQYIIPDNGHIKLENAFLSSFPASEDEAGLLLSNKGDKVALILDDYGDFWPMISLLTPDEAEDLAKKLNFVAAKVREYKGE